MAYNPEQAETLALQALAYIASDEQAMNALMAQSGMTPDDLRQAATDPAGLGGILDFLLQWEDLLVAFCEETGLSPEEPARARQALPGFSEWG